MEHIYLDNAAATKPSESIIKNLPLWSEALYANPSSLHKAGVDSFNAVEKVRAEFARFIGAKPDEIYFTGSGTEANNLAVFGAVSAHKRHHFERARFFVRVSAPVCRVRFLQRTATDHDAYRPAVEAPGLHIHGI